MNNTKKSGNWFIDQLAVYQSANSDNESIKNNFIIRKHEFESIIADLSNKKATDSLQHSLILGRRGSGKSTLLRRIQIEVEENAQLNKMYFVVYPPEEQAGIYRLFDLWEMVLIELANQAEVEIKLQEYSEFANENEFTRYLYNEIHTLLKKKKCKAILLLDNFDRIVENFSDDGNLLRETLINYNDILIIAGSTRMDEHFWNYGQPFYEFFRRYRLEALSSEEIYTLLNHWSNTMDIPELKIYMQKNPGKIETIRILTDGLPRTLQFFIQILLNDNSLYGYDYLKKIMDDVSPLYQERLNSLPPQHKKIVAEMAFIWEGCTTKQLVEKCRMQSNLISANLKQLIDKGIVDKLETRSKNHLYRISERFFNMWLIITQGNPEHKRKAKWLTVFLENWYDKTDLINLSNSHLKKLKEKSIDFNKAIIYSKALSQSKYLSVQQRDEMIELTENLLPKDINECCLQLPKKYSTIIKDIISLTENKNFDQAIELANEIENEEDGVKFYILGFINRLKNDFVSAEANYVHAIEKGHVKAMNNLASMYQEQKKSKEAEIYYLQAIEKGHAKAMYNLANMYREQKKFKEAETYYLQAIEKGHANAVCNIANMYQEQEKFKEAEKYYFQAIEKGHIGAMNNLANMYQEQKKFKEAETYYLQAIEKGNVDAMYNLANMYREQKKFKEAETFYLRAIEKDNIDAMNNLAIMYYYRNINKHEALDLIIKCNSFRPNVYIHQGLQIIIEVWNGVFENLENKCKEIIKKFGKEDKSGLFYDLLIQQQKSLVLKLFNDKELGKELQAKYQVMYYVTLLINHVYSEEEMKHKMPPELHETVNNILTEIMDGQKRYYS